MLRPFVFLVSRGACAIRALFLPRADLLIENLALRQQGCTLAWVIQQLRESFPDDTAPTYLIFDRDTILSAAVVRFVKAMGTVPLRTAYRSPWQNPVAERWIGSCRRELIEHVVVLGERHLIRLIRSYLTYYHEDRCHIGLAKDTPDGRLVTHRPSTTVKVVALPRVVGLHHRYEWREAA